MYSLLMREMWNILCSADQECKWDCEEEGQTGMLLNRLWADWQSIYTAICLVQYWLPLKVNATALKLTVSKVRIQH